MRENAKKSLAQELSRFQKSHFTLSYWAKDKNWVEDSQQKKHQHEEEEGEKRCLFVLDQLFANVVPNDIRFSIPKNVFCC